MIGNIVHSTVFKIAALMFLVSFLAIISMFSSVFISDSAQSDAEAINVAGSLRMQSYRLASLAQLKDKTPEQSQHFNILADRFTHDLENGVLVTKQALSATDESSQMLLDIVTQWQQEIRPILFLTANEEAFNPVALNELIQVFVDKIDALVSNYQSHAEKNIATIRLIQSVALFSTLLLIAFAMMIVNRHIKKPLSKLTDVAKQIGRGDFTSRADESCKGELALLGRTLNKMSDSIYRSQTQLETQVKRKTQTLTRTNESLNLLYSISRKLNNVDPMSVDFQPILKRLSAITGINDLDLCFMTAHSNGAYEHLVTSDKEIPEQCKIHDCAGCTEHHNLHPLSSKVMRYQLSQGGESYGVFSVNPDDKNRLEDWQHQLFESVAEQIANGLSMKHQLEQSRRMALMNERTVIARELHDSLAQALSYLKIQVTRLQRLKKQENVEEKMDAVIDELKTGLSAAYSELRELLTTFRLKLDGQGIKAALEQTFAQLKTRSDAFNFTLNYEVDFVPFSPQEEIHLLQIAREATQNAFYHSKGTEINVTVSATPSSTVCLKVSDNGIGIHGDPNKLNHYGLAIMKERSRNLNGELSIQRREQGGTEVCFTFLPEYSKRMVPNAKRA